MCCFFIFATFTYNTLWSDGIYSILCSLPTVQSRDLCALVLATTQNTKKNYINSHFHCCKLQLFSFLFFFYSLQEIHFMCLNCGWSAYGQIKYADRKMGTNVICKGHKWMRNYTKKKKENKRMIDHIATM